MNQAGFDPSSGWVSSGVDAGLSPVHYQPSPKLTMSGAAMIASGAHSDVEVGCEVGSERLQNMFMQTNFGSSELLNCVI